MQFRLLRDSDTGPFWSMIQHPSFAWVAQTLPPDPSLEFVRARIAKQFEHGLFTPQGVLVATGSTFRNRAGSGELEVGYGVHADHRRRGYATMLVSMLIEQARANGHDGPIFAAVAQDNIGSRIVLQKAGFYEVSQFRAKPMGRPEDVLHIRMKLDPDRDASPRA